MVNILIIKVTHLSFSLLLWSKGDLEGNLTPSSHATQHNYHQVPHFGMKEVEGWCVMCQEGKFASQQLASLPLVGDSLVRASIVSTQSSKAKRTLTTDLSSPSSLGLLQPSIGFLFQKYCGHVLSCQQVTSIQAVVQVNFNKLSGNYTKGFEKCFF